MTRFVKYRRFVLFFFLFLAYFSLSYYYFGGWWNSSAGTLSILLISYLIWGHGFLREIGLKLKPSRVLFSLLLAIAVFLVSMLVVSHIAGKNQITISLTNWTNYYHTAFYTLNEEIVVGAILLFLMTRKLRIGTFAAVTGLAVFFALFHYIFYRWIFDDRGLIGIITLSTLFLVGIVRNSLIVYTGHIGYSWALHFGWMAAMFGNAHIHADTGIPLREPERFNLYLGSFELSSSAVIMVFLIYLYFRRRTKRNTISIHN